VGLLGQLGLRSGSDTTSAARITNEGKKALIPHVRYIHVGQGLIRVGALCA